MTGCSSSRYHSLFLDPLGSVWSCGNDQCGFDHSSKVLIPKKINNLPQIISVSAGPAFSLFVDANGSVWGCGYNANGQLGLGDEKSRSDGIPVQITNLPKIISATALSTSSVFLDSEGSVWVCGKNEYGELGLGDTINRNNAEKIRGIPLIKSVAGGYSHSLFLDCEGSVWACGCNQNGQLGLGDRRNRSKPEKIGGLPAIKSMAGGWYSIFVDEEGNVWVCGANYAGELGMGHTTTISSPQKNNNLSGIIAVGGGYANYSVFLDNGGNIYTCGNNGNGQLGLGDTENRHTPQRVNNIPPMSFISSCNTAEGYLQIVDREGRVWSSGKNDRGQLGLGNTNPTLTFQRTEIIVKMQHQTTFTLSERAASENIIGGIDLQNEQSNLNAVPEAKIEEINKSQENLPSEREKADEIIKSLKKKCQILESTLFLTRNLKFQTLANFIPQKVLGRGNNGIVFLCKVKLGKQWFEVALKMIFNFAGSTTNSLKGEYENEYLILHRLQAIHPNIIHILWEFVAHPTPTLVEIVLANGIVEDALFSRNLQTGEKILRKTQFFVLEFHPMTLEEKLQQLGTDIEWERIYRYSLEIVECFLFYLTIILLTET